MTRLVLTKVQKSSLYSRHNCGKNMTFLSERSILMGAQHQLTLHRLPVVNGVVSMTICLLYKFLSSWQFTFSESRESKERNQSGLTIYVDQHFFRYNLSNFTIHFHCPVQKQPTCGCFQDTRRRRIMVKSLIMIMKCRVLQDIVWPRPK